jgi:hypothetical protein
MMLFVCVFVSNGLCWTGLILIDSFAWIVDLLKSFVLNYRLAEIHSIPGLTFELFRLFGR